MSIKRLIACRARAQHFAISKPWLADNRDLQKRNAPCLWLFSVGEEAAAEVKAKKTGKAPVPPCMRAGEPR